MADDSVATGGEGDLFDRWLAHREGEDHSGGQLRASTVPPKWAPQVVVPRDEPETPADVLRDASVAPVPVAPEPVVEAVVEVDVAAPVTEAPVEDEPVADEPVAEEPVVEEPVVEEPVVEEPVAEEHSVEQSVVEQPVHEEPVHDEPAPTRQLPVPEPPIDEDDAEDEPEPAAEPQLGPQGEPPVRMTFRPRTRARTAVGIGALLAATASVVGCYVAARERDEASIGIAVTLWVLTGIIWAVHSGTSVTRLSVRGGQLHVVRQGVRTTIDLTSSYTPVEVHGRPGKHGWRVVFRRRDLSTFVIDPSMVDPTEFMRVLRYYRPGVDAEAK
ncbi:hypothetical protein GCM10009798_15910 [Nocardioides panacihumi]|uniref:PH domain-containing protein n=1 Tax=Nocardioides panacihumi TaxID=400774 RepID=A0ABN2QS54_9ACTN